MYELTHGSAEHRHCGLPTRREALTRSPQRRGQMSGVVSRAHSVRMEANFLASPGHCVAGLRFCPNNLGLRVQHGEKSFQRRVAHVRGTRCAVASLEGSVLSGCLVWDIKPHWATILTFDESTFSAAAGPDEGGLAHTDSCRFGGPRCGMIVCDPRTTPLRVRWRSA